MSLCFFYVFIHLSMNGLKTHPEKNCYLDFPLTQREKNQQKQSRIPFPIESKKIGENIYDHMLEIGCTTGSRFDRISEVTFELSIPSEGQLVFANLTFPENNILQKDVVFTAAESDFLKTEGKLRLKKTSGFSQEKTSRGAVNGLLHIRTVGKSALSIWLNETNELHQTTIFWIPIPKTDADLSNLKYGNLLGYVQYFDEDLPVFSKAQLLAFVWGFGVNGQWFIYFLTGTALCLWILGSILLYKVPPELNSFSITHLLNSFGIACVFLGNCFVFSSFFPPFRGPDEVHHFTGFAEATNNSRLIQDSGQLANLGAFYRIHRLKSEKISSLDTIFQHHYTWPVDVTNPYLPTRSPFGMAVWKEMREVFRHLTTGHSMLALRILNGFFVALCLFASVCLMQAICPESKLTIIKATSLVWIPCIAHFSTVVSNYPYLIGGYSIQIVVLGVLWVLLDRKYLSKRVLAAVGALLGIGMAIGIGAADNAMASMPFWGVILPAFLAARRVADKSWRQLASETMALLIPFLIFMLAVLFLLGCYSINHSFLPGKASDAISNLIPFQWSPLYAGSALVFIYFLSICILTFVCYSSIGFINIILQNRSCLRIGQAILLTSALILLVISFRIPEINLSQGKGTTITGYPVLVLCAFFDGFIPGSVDGMVTGSFWRRLGWHDTYLPWAHMEILRLTMGLGIGLLLYRCLIHDQKSAIRFFGFANLSALVFCVIAIAMLYYSVKFNVNSRYLMICYMFASVIALEGYRQTLFRFPRISNQYKFILCGFLCFSIVLQATSWVSVLNRFF